MVQDCYTFRIRIANPDNVQVEILDPDNNPLGQPSGKFDYSGRTRTFIQELHHAAREGKLTGLDVQELGQRLFVTLFDEVLRRDFFGLYERVRRENAFLRLELDVDERQLPEVAALPWEFMCVPSDANYGTTWLATAPNLVFSRRRALWIEPKPIQLGISERLRIALAVAAPDSLGPVKYERIWETLRELASDQVERIELLELVNPATPRTIDAALEREPHIFHFIGHARLKDKNRRDTGQVALVDDKLNTPMWVGAEHFSELFTRYRPGVVVLQACEGAALSSSEAFVGVASQVIQQNIPVVVAMQYRVSNSTARRFTLEFYRRLSNNDPVDKAVQEGRRRIALEPISYTTHDFATPVLFMRVRLGHLFQRLTIDVIPEVTDYAKGPDKGKRAVKPPPKSLKAIENPYVVGSPAHPPMFFGRTELLESLQKTFESTRPYTQVIYLFGMSRIGKTSVLHQLHRQSSGKCLYAFVDLQVAALEGTEGLLYYIARAIADALKYGSEAKDVAEPERIDFAGQGGRSLFPTLRTL